MTIWTVVVAVCGAAVVVVLWHYLAGRRRRAEHEETLAEMFRDRLAEGERHQHRMAEIKAKERMWRGWYEMRCDLIDRMRRDSGEEWKYGG